MPSFQNPLGALMPVARKQALVQLLARHDVPLIEDDVYGELYTGTQRPPPAKAFDTQGLVLHCASFSKCLAPGYRVGWAAAGRYGAAVQRLKMMSSLATSLPPQRALAEYLAQGGYERHLRGLRWRPSTRALALIDRSSARHPRHPPGRRLFSVAGAAARGGRAAPARAGPQQGISCAPGVLFSADRRFTHHLRLNIGHPGDARFDGALRSLGRLAQGLAQAGGAEPALRGRGARCPGP
jgi:DNA-binding transcriptional MocR family regulator